MYCIRESFQQRSTGIVFHPQLAQSPCSQCFSSFLYRSNPEPVLHGVRIWCTPSFVHSLWRHFLVAFFRQYMKYMFCKKIAYCSSWFCFSEKHLNYTVFYQQILRFNIITSNFLFLCQSWFKWSAMTKEYISIKNTKQPFLVFIPPPFTLESRKCKENS